MRTEGLSNLTQMTNPQCHQMESIPSPSTRWILTCSCVADEELKDRSVSRMRTVSSRAMGLCLVLYSAIGVAGYFEFGSAVRGNILDNYEIGWNSVHARLMLPAFGAIALTVLMAYPLNIYPCRYTLDVMVCGSLGNRYRRARHISWTVFISLSGLLVGIFVPGINIVFQLLGGTSSAFVCFMLPAAVGWRLDLPEASGARRWCCALLLVSGCVVGISSTAVTFMDLLS
jgi:amino acid permease